MLVNEWSMEVDGVVLSRTDAGLNSHASVRYHR